MPFYEFFSLHLTWYFDFSLHFFSSFLYLSGVKRIVKVCVNGEVPKHRGTNGRYGYWIRRKHEFCFRGWCGGRGEQIWAMPVEEGKNINVRAMKFKMTDIWKPTMGINGGLWSFDNAMLIVNLIPSGLEPLKVPQWFLNMWIQIYDLSSESMSKARGKQLEFFLGSFSNMMSKKTNLFG